MARRAPADVWILNGEDIIPQAGDFAVTSCKHHTTPYAFHTRKHFLACGLSFTARIVFVSFAKQSSPNAQIMFHEQSPLLDYPPLPLPHGAPSLLFLSHVDIHCDPLLGGESGRLAEQSHLTGYEPNDPVEVISAEVTPMLRVSGRLTILAATSPPRVSSEVDERQSIGMLASPLFTLKREASAAPSRVYHLN